MKKLLLIGLILAILLLAFPQGVMAAAPQDVVVNANYQQTDVVFTADPAAPWSWTLLADDADSNLYPAALVFTVTSNADWTVSAEDTKTVAQNKGHMIEAGTGGSHFLKQLFEIQNPANNGFLTLEGSGPVLIQSGLATVTGFNKDIRQSVLTADRDYASSSGYTITVTFTCTNGFGGT
jgi:hypothetical protein